MCNYPSNEIIVMNMIISPKTTKTQQNMEGTPSKVAPRLAVNPLSNTNSPLVRKSRPSLL